MMNAVKKSFIICALLVVSSVSALATEEVAAVAAVTPETTVISAATPENEIPLKIAQAGKSDAQSASGQKAIFTIGILLALAGAGYYAVRRFSHANKPGKSNMQIKILSQHYLGPKKSLAVIRVAGESILIGITDQNISMMKTLALLDDELPQVLPKDFNESMTEQGVDQDIETDDFSFEGIKSTVSEKIKSMRNIQ
jgi:flagellar protein FliO/FliZ